MSQLDDYTQLALDHICHLSERIGARGSCTAAERQAAEYTADQMRTMGARDVRLEPCRGAPSTYRPYVLAFLAALLGTLLVWLVRERWMLAVAALLSALGAWGMLAESDLAGSWMRRLLPRAASQNAVGVLSPSGKVKHRAVLCAHLDTHRTPIFYSSITWYMLFAVLVGGSFVSMAVAALVYALGALFDWSWVRWIGLVAAVLQFFAISPVLTGRVHTVHRGRQRQRLGRRRRPGRGPPPGRRTAEPHRGVVGLHRLRGGGRLRRRRLPRRSRRRSGERCRSHHPRPGGLWPGQVSDRRWADHQAQDTSHGRCSWPAGQPTSCPISSCAGRSDLPTPTPSSPPSEA